MDAYRKEWRRGEQKFFPNRVEIVEVELRDDGKEVGRSVVCWVNANHPGHEAWIERMLERADSIDY